jgi:TolB-like protein/Tfp pilus assembly protein PilF
MTQERWEKVENIFHAALDREPGERSRFLDLACAGDDALRQEVESLLQHEPRSDEFLKSPALELAAELLATDQTNSQYIRKIGPYYVLSFIGAGGMGEVYLAQDSRLGRKVALKLLPQQFTQDIDSVRRFEREARAASALNHPNILTIYDIGAADQVQYIATEFIEGQTLRRRMMSGAMEMEEILSVATQTAGALVAAHDAGIVHRDIKPENIMIRQDGLIKVLDFGLAKLVDIASPMNQGEALTMGDLNTETGIVLGTARYMSPEQARGQTADARADLFSLGIVIYEMVASKPPFSGETQADVIAALLAIDPTPLSQISPEVPQVLDAVVMRALRKNVTERYQTTVEMLDDLKEIKRQFDFEKEFERSKGREHKKASSSKKGARTKSQKRKGIDSLAVLPLINTSQDPNTEYLGDGITESIITTISQFPGLRVMAWSTVSRYKNEQSDPQGVGRKLGVRAVLTGRILQQGDRLIIKAELVDSNDGSRLWGEQYTSNRADLLSVEENIAKEISEKLLPRLTGEEKKQLKTRFTDNVEAYHAYLRGRYYWNKRTAEDLRKAIENFTQAIDIDPCLAPAYSGLADSYLILGSFGIATLSPKEAFPKAKEAATKALEIDDTLPEPHATLGHILTMYEWNWIAAEKEFKRSFELKPDYSSSHHWYGMLCLVAMGRLEDGLSEVRRAENLDPLSLSIGSDVGFVLYLARRYNDAIDQYRKLLEMDQNFTYTHWKLGLAYEQKGMYSEAILEFQKAISLSGKSTLPLTMLGHAYAASENFDAAFETLDQLKKLSEERYVSPYRVALIYVALEDFEAAFHWLERAYEGRDGWLIWMTVDPEMDPLRSDPRLTDLLNRVAGIESKESPLQTELKTLAVIPFKSIQPDQRDEYLQLGIADALITKLSSIKQIAVRPTSSVRKFAETDHDSLSAGRELKVDSVLEGTLQKQGQRIRVTARLVSIATGRTLWAEKLDENFNDIFQIEDLISEKVVSALALKLDSEEKRRLAKRYTENVEAYQAYVKGRYFWYKRTEEALQKGIEFFQEAIEKDPTYAAAYDGLSDSYALLALRGIVPAKEAFPKAKAAATKALEIDPDLGEAYASLAHVRLHDWDWSALENDFKQAIHLNPGHAIAYHWYSEYLLALGRSDEAVKMMKKAHEIDPISPVINSALGSTYYLARMYDKAIEQFLQGLEIHPQHFLIHYNLGRAYLKKQMYEAAIQSMRKGVMLSGRSVESLAGLGEAYAAAAMPEFMEEILAELMKMSETQYVSPYYVARIYAAAGDREKAFDWLEKGFQERNPDLIELNVEPLLDSLRTDGRFHDLLRRIGLAERESQRKPMSASGKTSLKTVAVLPFKPINVQQRDEYLELGIADALITKLSDLTQIIVRPTSAVRKYLELDQDPVVAGRELQVESILEGSIQKHADRIRVTARLVSADDGRSLWTGKFDEKFTDIFAVEDSISEKLVAALVLKITDKEKAHLAKRYTESAEAYHLYLKGRYYWNKRAEGELLQSIECFRQAIAIDPNFALAYAGLGDSYTYLGDAGITAISPREAFSKGKAAAAKALDIDDSLAEAHAVMAHLNLHFFQWLEAEKEFNRTVELKPNYPTIYQVYSYYLLFIGKVEEGLATMSRALELDPLSESINADAGDILYFARRYDDAIEQLQKLLRMDPGYSRARCYLARTYQAQGRHDEAFAELEKAMKLTNRNMETLAAMAHHYAVTGMAAEARSLLAELMEQSKQKYLSPYNVALIHSALEEKDEAFQFLEIAYENRAEWMIYLSVDPRLDTLRSDPRFEHILRKTGLK